MQIHEKLVVAFGLLVYWTAGEARAEPVTTLPLAIPSSTLVQSESRNSVLTPAQIKYIEARMDARSILPSGKGMQEAMAGFAKHYDRATDLQILSVVTIVGSSVVGGLFVQDRPKTAFYIVLGGSTASIACLVGSWIQARLAAREILGGGSVEQAGSDRWHKREAGEGTIGY